MTKVRTPSTCAICGAAIPPKARACPECGADERTGWDEQSVYDGMDLPEESFLDGPVDQNEREKIARLRKAKATFWWCVALGLLIVFVAGALALR